MNQKNTFDIPTSVCLSLLQNGETYTFGDGRSSVRIETEDVVGCYTVGDAKRQFRQMARATAATDIKTYFLVVPQNPSIFAFDKS